MLNTNKQNNNVFGKYIATHEKQVKIEMHFAKGQKQTDGVLHRNLGSPSLMRGFANKRYG